MTTTAYNPEDAATANQDKYTAQAVLGARDGGVDAERAEQAATAGVREARFIGYADVLGVYEARSDTEHTADIRARHLAATAAEQDFARAAGYDGNSGKLSHVEDADQDGTADPEPTP